MIVSFDQLAHTEFAKLGFLLGKFLFDCTPFWSVLYIENCVDPHLTQQVFYHGGLMVSHVI